MAPRHTSLERRYPTHTQIWTDGSCTEHGGGGWAAIIVSPRGYERPVYAHVPHTTPARMEMTAALEGLRACRGRKLGKDKVVVISDSQYLVHGMAIWRHKWRQRDWKTATGTKVSNRDIWDALILEVECHPVVRWEYVQAHAGIKYNEAADKLAKAARDRSGMAERLAEKPVEKARFW